MVEHFELDEWKFLLSLINWNLSGDPTEIRLRMAIREKLEQLKPRAVQYAQILKEVIRNE